MKNNKINYKLMEKKFDEWEDNIMKDKELVDCLVKLGDE